MVLKDADGRHEELAELMELREMAKPSDQKTFDRQIRSINIGMVGERDAAHFLNREFGRSRTVGVLHDLRLCVDADVAQIDHLIIHRVQQTAWVLETKNYSGRLTCDEHGDWTIWRGGRAFDIASPVNQARRQAALLSAWFEDQAITNIRKIEPVVLISPRSSVSRKYLEKGDDVVKADNFGRWWNDKADKIGLATIAGMVGRHLVNRMSEDDLIELGRRLKDAHVPITRDWRASLRLPPLQAATVEDQVSNDDSGARVIETAVGRIKISQLPDGRFALRNDSNDALIEIVKASCRGLARWHPRYRNWVFAEDSLDEIISRIEKRRKGPFEPSV